MELFEPFGAVTLDSRKIDQFAVELGDHYEGSLAQLPCILRNRLEHRLHVA